MNPVFSVRKKFEVKAEAKAKEEQWAINQSKWEVKVLREPCVLRAKKVEVKAEAEAKAKETMGNKSIKREVKVLREPCVLRAKKV